MPRLTQGVQKPDTLTLTLQTGTYVPSVLPRVPRQTGCGTRLEAGPRRAFTKSRLPSVVPPWHCCPAPFPVLPHAIRIVLPKAASFFFASIIQPRLLIRASTLFLPRPSELYITFLSPYQMPWVNSAFALAGFSFWNPPGHSGYSFPSPRKLSWPNVSPLHCCGPPVRLSPLTFGNGCRYGTLMGTTYPAGRGRPGQQPALSCCHSDAGRASS